MIRLIKRYESRKLYDTEESRYISLDEVAKWVREGQDVRVVDNKRSEDVTAQTLAQIILDEGRNGGNSLPTELMHELVRFGGKAWSTGVEQVTHGVDRFVQASIDRISPVRKAREEMDRLRSQLEQIESSLSDLADAELATASASAPKKAPAKKAPAKKVPVAKTAKKSS